MCQFGTCSVSLNVNFRYMSASASKPQWLSKIFSDAHCEVMFTSRGATDASSSAYSDFNPCHYTGDDPEHVAASRLLLAGELGIADEALIVPRQTHSSRVCVIDGIPVSKSSLEGVDALVTRMRGVAVGVSTADCVPLVLVDGESGVAGVAHAGWRGAVGGVVRNLFEEMLRQGAQTDGIRAFFGPAICCDCFEVGEEVAAFFPEEYVVRCPQWPKPHVDLPLFVAGQLIELGVAPERIAPFRPDICTRCHPDRYFSARDSGIESGRNFTFVMLK